jgi:hypothetical protein
MRLEGLGKLKIPMYSSGIEPATFLLVAQCPFDDLRSSVIINVHVRTHAQIGDWYRCFCVAVVAYSLDGCSLRYTVDFTENLLRKPIRILFKKNY